MMAAFARNQWYVAAYGREVGRELFARTVLGEPIVFYRTESGEVVALADRCVHRRFPLSESRLEGDRIICGYHGFTYDRAGSCVSVPGQTPDPPHRAGSVLPRGRAGLVRLGLDRRPRPGRPGRDPARAVARRSGVHHGERDGTARRAVRAARGQPARPLPRDLPARRLHRHAGGRGHPHHHGGRRGPRHHLRQPAHGRRGVPAVLREVHRHRRPDHALAGHRVPPALPVPAAQPDRAGRRAAERRRHRPRRLPRRGRLRDHAGDRAQHARLLGGGPGLRARGPGRVGLPGREQPHGGAAGRATRSTSSNACIAAEPEGYQELSVNIDTGGLAARRILAKLAAGVPS